MRFKITVKGDAAKSIEKMQAHLANGQALMANIGKGFEITLQRHFRALNKRPNKRGWRKTNFWSGIAKSTTFVSTTSNTATVAIQEGRKFAAKVFGATIRPTGGRKFLAIPSPLVSLSPRPPLPALPFFQKNFFGFSFFSRIKMFHMEQSFA